MSHDSGSSSPCPFISLVRVLLTGEQSRERSTQDLLPWGLEERASYVWKKHVSSGGLLVRQVMKVKHGELCDTRLRC